MDETYCKLCLVTNVKMYIMSSSEWILDTYSQLLQLPISSQEHHVCFSCVNMLYRIKKFRTQCYTAHKLLTLINPDSQSLEIKKYISNIDRKKHKLESNLTIAPIIEITTGAENVPSLDASDNNVINTKDMRSQQEIKSFSGIPKIREEKFIIINDIFSPENDNHIANFNDNRNKDMLKLTESEIDSDEGVSETYANDSNYSSGTEDNIVPQVGVSKKKNIDNVNKLKKIIIVKEPVEKNKNSDDNTINVSNNCSSDEDISLADESRRKKAITNNVRVKKIIIIKQPVEHKRRRKSEGRKTVNIYESFMRMQKLTPEQALNEMHKRKEFNSKQFSFICTYCFRGYLTKAKLDLHMKRHSPEHGPIECDICHQRFKTKLSWQQHFYGRHTRKYDCKKCSYTCLTSNQARLHVNSHQGAKYPCGDCGKVFLKLCTLSNHKTKHHVKDYICDLCGSAFPSERGVMCHQNIRHKHEKNEGRGPTCDECEMQFASELAFKRHLIFAPKHKSNNCKECGEEFLDKITLALHERKHKRASRANGKGETIICPVCNSMLRTRRGYVRHVLSTHPHTEEAERINSIHTVNREKFGRAGSSEPIICEVCGKSFLFNTHLLIHQRTHTGDRPYPCSTCGKLFSTAGGLESHMQTHKASRPYIACSKCPKKFLTSSALGRHTKVTHLGLRPHKCPICGKAFLNKCEVNIHNKYVHLKVPWPKRDRSKRKALAKAKNGDRDSESMLE